MTEVLEDTAAGAPAASQPAESDKPVVGLPQKLSWGAGQLSFAIAFSVIGTQFLLFVTAYIGLSPAVASAIFATAKLIDIPTDVMVGSLSDRTKTRWGRRRPWIFVASITLMVAVIGLFHLDHLSRAAAPAAAMGLLLLFYFGYSAITIPLMAMSAEITGSYRERSTLWSIANTFMTIGVAAGIALTPKLMGWMGGGVAGYHGMSIIMGLAIFVIGMVCFVGTAKTPNVTPPKRERVPFRDWISSLATNKPLVIYLLSVVPKYFALAIPSITMTYYVLNVLQKGQDGMVYYGLAGTGGQIAGILPAMWLLRHAPKHLVAGIGTLGIGICMLSFRLLDSHSSIWLFTAICVLWGFITFSVTVALNAMIPDIIQADTARTGLRREGAISSLSQAIQKTTPAIATMAFGVLLEIGGYVPGRGAAAQPQSAIDMIYLINCVIPGVILLLSPIPILFFYKLTEKTLKDMEARATP